MPISTQAASFEDFLNAPARLAAGSSGVVVRPQNECSPETDSCVRAATSDSKNASEFSPKKEKVGLTIDSAIVEAVDDYIYQERKRGRRLKKNGVYEAALRQFLGLEGGGLQ